MISTHDSLFSDRLLTYLLNRGVSAKRHAETFVASLSAAEMKSNFLSKLFSFPYLDFAFFRYPAEMVELDGSERLTAFGSCLSGLFVLRGTGEVAIFDEEERITSIAESVDDFCAFFHLLVHAATSPLEEVDRSREILVHKLSGFATTPFWSSALNSIVEGDAAPRYHLLTALIDGAVERVV